MSGVGFYGLQKNLTINVLDTALGIQREEGLVLALKDTQLSGDGGQDVNKVILCLQIQLFFFFLQVSSVLGTCGMNGAGVEAKNKAEKGQ